MIRNHVEFARAALARWGSALVQPIIKRLPDGSQVIEPQDRALLVPQPQPPADGEVAELVAQLRVIGNDYGVRHSADCRRAADLLERQQWQLIKDAPRDGTEIWASDFDAIEIVHWQGRARFDVDSEGEWITREGDYLFPACWQPLPDHPPLPSEEEQ